MEEGGEMMEWKKEQKNGKNRGVLDCKGMW